MLKESEKFNKSSAAHCKSESPDISGQRGPDQPKCPLTESLDNIECICMNGELRSR